MRPPLLSLLTALPLSTASPAPHHPRDLGSAINNAVANIGAAIHSAASAASSSVPALISESGSTLGVLSSIPCTSAPIKNEAIWQEALSLDAGGPVKVNQMLYGQIACYQGMENSSRTAGFSNALSSASWIGKGLQGLHAYPAQFGRAQVGGGEGVLIQLSPTPQQTITSFGASGAWWPNFLKDFPPTQQKNLSKLLFSKDGLHLSGYRYNIGATGSHDNVTISTPGRSAESFLTTTGTYNWQRDGPGVYYLKAAQEANVSSLTFFANAMPSNLTSFNATTPCGSTLTSAQLPHFAEYLVNVLRHMLEWGISVSYISPINEPNNAFSTCTQEGMRVPPSLRAPLFRALRSALHASPTPAVRGVKILGDETSQITTQALAEYNTWLPTALQQRSIDAIAAHMYDWPDDATLLNYRQLLVNISHPNAPPPVKMTEISSFMSAKGRYRPWGWTGPKIMGSEFDPGMDSALDMARFVWQWLALVNAESWDWWTAVSNMLPCFPSVASGCAALFNGGERRNGQQGWNDGLVYIDPQYAITKDYGFYLTKRFWVFRHFSKFLRPGAVRYDVPNEVLPYGTVAVAGRNVDGVYSVVFVNRNATSQGVRMKLPGEGGKVTVGVQTTEKADWENIPLPVVKADGTFTMTLPARGVLSIQFTVNEAGAISSRRRRTTDGYEYQHMGAYLDYGKGHDDFL